MLIVFDLAIFVVVLVIMIEIFIIVILVFMVVVFVVVMVFFVIMILIYIMFMFVFVIMAFHAFDDLFFLDGIAEFIHEVDYDHVLVGCFLENVVDPFVGFSADINEYVACGDLKDVGCRGLVAVKVCSVIEKHGDFGVCRVVAEDVHYPVVFREDGCYYL